jgi:hypothetical protein
MADEIKPFDTVVQEALEADQEFQVTLSGLEDYERTEAISKKRGEISDTLYRTLSADAKKNADIGRDQKIRAEKAERERDELMGKGKGAPPKDDALSTAEIYTLVQAQVPPEDVPEVQKAAKLLGVDLTTALKDPMVQSVLKQRAETRATANATDTAGKKAPVGQTSDQELLDKASKGEVPEPGSPEAERLFWLRRGGKK